MNSGDLQYKTDGMFHEIQVGTFSIIGRFPVLVLSQLKEIFEKSCRPLFVGPGPSVQVILDDVDEAFKCDPVIPNRILILDPLNDSHINLANRYQGNVSWFCIRNLHRFKDRGIYFDNVNQELIYVNGSGRENYLLPGSIQVTRDLAAAICAARESGIRPDEIRLAFNANASFLIPHTYLKFARSE